MPVPGPAWGSADREVRCETVWWHLEEWSRYQILRLVRRIFPIVATIDHAGYSALTQDEVGARAEAQLGGREEGEKPSKRKPFPAEEYLSVL